MNKTLLITSFVLSAFISSSALAVKTFNGPTELKDDEFNEEVVVNGPLKFRDVTFSKQLKVNGPITGTDATFNDVIVMGPADIKDAEAKSFDVTGPLSLTGTTANIIKSIGPVSLDDSEVKVIETDATSIVIKNSDVTSIKVTSKGKSNLVVKAESTIGKADFVNKNGTVVIEDSFSTVKEIVGANNKK